MLNFLSTFGGDSQFQKNRLLLTKPTYESPNQQALRNMLHSFAGQDEQTRSQIAFATIIKKMHLSNGKQNWVYLLKNLIILDRVMSDNRFCEQLAQTNIGTVNNYVDKDARSQSVNGKYLLKTFWQVIQELCRLKISREQILYYKRSQRKTYLDKLTTQQLFKQIKMLQKMFDLSLSLIFLTSGITSHPQKTQRQTEVISQKQKQKKHYTEFTNSPLAQYLNIHVYSKLLTFFSCQYLCIHKFIQLILHTTTIEKHSLVSVDDAKLFKKMVLKFKNNCLEMKLLVERNKNKKGFENIDTKEFSAFSEEHIIKAIDQYIAQHSTCQKLQVFVNLEMFMNLSSSGYLKLPQTSFVDKKPLIFRRGTGGSRSPRRHIQFKKDHEEQKAFSDYFDSYSDEFPHKNMMTIDLIEDIRRDEEKMYQQILNSAQFMQEKQSNKQIKNKKQDQPNFFKEFRKLKTKLKFHDILVFDKEQKQQKEQDSTSYSFKNSSREDSLFDVLNIKWIPQKSQV